MQSELMHAICAFAPFLILRAFYQEAERHLKWANEAAQALNDKNGIVDTLLYLGKIEQRQITMPKLKPISNRA